MSQFMTQETLYDFCKNLFTIIDTFFIVTFHYILLLILHYLNIVAFYHSTLVQFDQGYHRVINGGVINQGDLDKVIMDRIIVDTMNR